MEGGIGGQPDEEADSLVNEGSFCQRLGTSTPHSHACLLGIGSWGFASDMPFLVSLISYGMLQPQTVCLLISANTAATLSRAHSCHPSLNSLCAAALEVFFLSRKTGPAWGAASAFIALSSTEDRDEVVSAIQRQAAFGADAPGGCAAATANSAILEVTPSTFW